MTTGPNTSDLPQRPTKPGWPWFTAAMLASIVATGIVTGSAGAPLSAAAIDRYGFALHDLWEGRAYTVVTSVFCTNRPLMFWGILPFVVLSIGALEWRAGTRRAVTAFWLTDFASNAVVTLLLVLPAYWLDTNIGRELVLADEVGMSAGGFGCVGASVAMLTPSARRLVTRLLVVYLLARLLLFTDLYSDVVHLVAWWIGGQVGRRWPMAR